MRKISFFWMILLLSAFTGALGQISLFKNINLEEAGSTPSNFVEMNGEIYFAAQGSDGPGWWKTNGSEIGTVKISDQYLYTYRSSLQKPIFFVLNNQLYYYVFNFEKFVTELFKTDGQAQTFVEDSSYNKHLGTRIK